MIKDITARTGASINVDDSGRIDVASADGSSVKTAIAMIQALTREAEVGKIYTGTVRKIASAARSWRSSGHRWLVHISVLSDKRASDVLKQGDEVLVKVLSIDRTGKIRLSRKEAGAVRRPRRSRAQAQAIRRRRNPSFSLTG